MRDISEPVERWLPVIGHTGYEVSDQGRIRSLDRNVRANNGWTHHYRGMILTPTQDGRGYCHVTLRADGGKRRLRRVHQLVAEAFLGPCPAGHEVRHGANGPTDNGVANLTYGTHSANMLDMSRDGTNWLRNRAACPRRHLLQPPNLVASKAARGIRTCLACHRGDSAVRHARRTHGIELDLQTESDRHYRRLMASHQAAGVTGAVAEL